MYIHYIEGNEAFDKTKETKMNISEQIRNLKPGFQTKPMTFGKVSTWFERSGDGKTVRLIRETKTSKFGSISEIVRAFNFNSI